MTSDSSSPTPLVSIITATFNSGQTVRDTLQSIANQTYPGIEHIVIDGGSKDNTLAVVSEFPHVAKVISEPDKGIYDAMNKGIKFATGEIIALLNSDDFYLSNNIVQKAVDLMQSEKTDTLYGDLVYVDPVDTQKISRTWIAGPFHRKNFLYGWMPPHPTFFVRKNLYDRLGHFDIRLKSAADYELMLRFLFKEKVSVSYLRQVMVKMRSGGMSNASLGNRIQANKEDREAWRTNQLHPYFFTLWLKPLRKLFQFFRKPNSII